MGASVGQQGAGRGTILAVLGLLAAATTGYFFAVPGGSTGGMIFKEGTAAGTPASGERVVYAKTTGVYAKDSAGTETQLDSSGISGLTTNTLPKAASATTLGDSSFTNASAGALGVGNDTDIAVTAGTVSSGTTGKNITLTASAAKAGSGANGGHVVAVGGAGDGGGIRGGLSIGGNGASYPVLYDTSGKLVVYQGDRTTLAELNIGPVTATGAIRASNTISSATYLGISNNSSAGVFFTYPVDGVATLIDWPGAAAWIQDSAGRDYATADQTVDSTTLTADDTISLTLKAGRKYKFTLIYFFTPGDTVADGLKFDMNGGTATMTGFEARVRVVDNVGQDVSVTNSRMTALNTAVSLTGNQPATSFTMYVDGFAEVNAAGTFIPEFAKSADAGTGVVKKKYSQIEALDYP